MNVGCGVVKMETVSTVRHGFMITYNNSDQFHAHHPSPIVLSQSPTGPTAINFRRRKRRKENTSLDVAEDGIFRVPSAQVSNSTTRRRSENTSEAGRAASFCSPGMFEALQYAILARLPRSFRTNVAFVTGIALHSTSTLSNLTSTRGWRASIRRRARSSTQWHWCG